MSRQPLTVESVPRWVPWATIGAVILTVLGMLQRVRALLERRAQPVPDRYRRPLLAVATIGLGAALVWAWNRAELTLDDLEWAFNFLFVGLLADPQVPEYPPGEYLVRNIVDADPEAGVIGISAHIQEGQHVLLVQRELRFLHGKLRLQSLALQFKAIDPLGGLHPGQVGRNLGAARSVQILFSRCVALPQCLDALAFLPGQPRVLVQKTHSLLRPRLFDINQPPLYDQIAQVLAGDFDPLSEITVVQLHE